MPFILFDKQQEFVQFVEYLIDNQQGGLLEKCRDMGATWLCCAISVCIWLFVPGASIGWGSRKEQLVDKIGDPDSIFEKIRIIIDKLPYFFLPVGYSPKQHSTYMKLINPETGATITGEAGDNIGRGGRKSVYFVDESAHIERPEKVEKALSETTNCRIDLSSVNGTANIFARRRQAGVVWEPGIIIPRHKTAVFIMDWRDHPLKDQQWYDIKRARAEEEGLLHVFAQEVDRDYAAAVEGVIIPAQWVQAAVDADVKLGLTDAADGETRASLDVADEGGDKNALAIIQGIVLKYIDEWAEGDTGQSAQKTISQCIIKKVTMLQYDCIGVGAGVKSETNRLKRDGALPVSLKILPWNAAIAPLFPDGRVIKKDKDSPKNKDFYANLKAQGWWELRKRFLNTFNAVTKNAEYDVSELIVIPSNIKNFHSIVAQLSQPTYKHDGRGRILVDKKPEGTKSPNIADAIMMACWPVRKQKVLI